MSDVADAWPAKLGEAALTGEAKTRREIRVREPMNQGYLRREAEPRTGR